MTDSFLIKSVTDQFPDAALASHTYRGDATVVLRRESLLEVARFLKENPALKMNFLMDLTAVDYSTFGKAARSSVLLFLRSGGEADTSDSGSGTPGQGRRTAPASRSCTTSTRRPTSIDYDW